MKKQYSEEIILSLLDNDSFIQWVIEPTAESDMFWQQQMDYNDELTNCIHDLKNIIQKLRTEEPSLSAGDKKMIWQQIEQTITKKEEKKKQRLKIWSRVAVAALLTGLLAGGTFYLFNQNPPEEIDYLSLIDETPVSQTENVSLILSENKVVEIPQDSSSVVYDATGKINVDEEPIEETGNKSPSLNQLIVPYGKTTFLTLSDGTKIWVNSGSTLIYPSVFEKDKREIFLIGEVYADVTKNEKAPFIIKTNHMDINVLGTEFNVSAYNDEGSQSVVLVSGAVNVKSKEQKESYTIHPNQMFTYETTSSQAEIREVDVNDHISWIHGYLIFHSERFDYVLRKLEKHFNVPFSYQTGDFEHIYVSGKLDMKDSLEKSLRNISVTVPIDYRENDGTFTIELIP